MWNLHAYRLSCPEKQKERYETTGYDLKDFLPTENPKTLISACSLFVNCFACQPVAFSELPGYPGRGHARQTTVLQPTFRVNQSAQLTRIYLGNALACLVLNCQLFQHLLWFFIWIRGYILLRKINALHWCIHYWARFLPPKGWFAVSKITATCWNPYSFFFNNNSA